MSSRPAQRRKLKRLDDLYDAIADSLTKAKNSKERFDGNESVVSVVNPDCVPPAITKERQSTP